MTRALRYWFRKDHYYKPGEQVMIVCCFALLACGIAIIIAALIVHVFLPL